MFFNQSAISIKPTMHLRPLQLFSIALLLTSTSAANADPVDPDLEPMLIPAQLVLSQMMMPSPMSLLPKSSGLANLAGSTHGLSGLSQMSTLSHGTAGLSAAHSAALNQLSAAARASSAATTMTVVAGGVVAGVYIGIGVAKAIQACHDNHVNLKQAREGQKQFVIAQKAVDENYRILNEKLAFDAAKFAHQYDDDGTLAIADPDNTDTTSVIAGADKMDTTLSSAGTGNAYATSAITGSDNSPASLADVARDNSDSPLVVVAPERINPLQ